MDREWPTKLVTDLRPGDRTPWWEVVGQPFQEELGGEWQTVVEVQFPDGGRSLRVFDAGYRIEIADD